MPSPQRALAMAHQGVEEIILKRLGGNDTLDAQEGAGNDKVDGGKGSADVCQTDAGDQRVNCP
jgi:hypothetical protein